METPDSLHSSAAIWSTAHLIMFPSLRSVLIAFATALPGHLALQAQAQFHGIGDLPGGIVFSEVRDAVKVNGEIRAVGGSVARSGSTASDTAVLWTSTGGLTALPNLVPNIVANSFITASAITPDGRYIATRSRNSSSGGSRVAARMTVADRSILSFDSLAGFSGNSAATSISADGSVLYGLANNNSQAVRYTSTGPTGTLIPLLAPSDSGSVAAPRGCSADGSVMVGSSQNAAGGRAFRFVQGTGASLIPLLPGGTYNGAGAVTPDGKTVLVFGDSTSAPKGEAYLYYANSKSIDRLGTPRGDLDSALGGSLTADASVVLTTFNNGSTTDSNTSYLHNAQGWHPFKEVATATGVLPPGWSLDVVLGVSADGTLVWGRGVHQGNEEGWVFEFPAGYLSGYSEPVRVRPEGQDLVGGWTFSDLSNPAGDLGILFFLPTGEYVFAASFSPQGSSQLSSGIERGSYDWNPVTSIFRISTLNDANGDIGISETSSFDGMQVIVRGDNLTAITPSGETNHITRLANTSGLAGLWLQKGSDVLNGHYELEVFLTNGVYLHLREGPSIAGGISGLERGTYTWNATSGAFTSKVTQDFNGSWSLDPTIKTIVIQGDSFATFTRVQGGASVDPLTVRQSPAGTVSLDLFGRSGHALRLEGSGDLKTWTPISTNLPINGMIHVTDTTPTGMAIRYYRTVELP